MDSSTSLFGLVHFQYEGCPISFFFIITIRMFYRNSYTECSVDPDQTTAASDLGLHCLPMSFLWDARHKWINICVQIIGKVWQGDKVSSIFRVNTV